MPAILVLLLVAASAAYGANTGGRVEYIGGTVTEISQDADGRLQTTDDEAMVFYSKKTRIQVPYDRINMIEYGQKVDRRYAMAVLVSPMFLLSKSRKHFLTVGYMDDQGKQQAMIFKVAKSDVRSVLVSLEARTGRKVQFQDDEARKAGKG